MPKAEEQRTKLQGIHQIAGGLQQEVFFIGVRYATWYRQGPYSNPDPDALVFHFYTTEKTLKREVNAALKNPQVLKVVEGRFTMQQLLEQFGRDGKPYGEPTREPEVMQQAQSYLHGESGLTKAQLLKKIGGLLP